MSAGQPLQSRSALEPGVLLQAGGGLQALGSVCIGGLHIRVLEMTLTSSPELG